MVEAERAQSMALEQQTGLSPLLLTVQTLFGSAYLVAVAVRTQPLVMRRLMATIANSINQIVRHPDAKTNKLWDCRPSARATVTAVSPGRSDRGEVLSPASCELSHRLLSSSREIISVFH